MILNSALGDRLNEVKKGNDIPKPPSDKINIIKKDIEIPVQTIETSSISPKTILMTNIIDLIGIIIMSIIYGFGISTLLNKSWNFIGIFSVGFLVYQLLFLLTNLFSKTK